MLPKSIRISEVAPRDGLQIEKSVVAASDKIALVDAISASGVASVEVTGFVHPKVIPQMADAAEVCHGIARRPGIRYGAFVPNAKGAARAIECGLDDIKCGAATSDTFNELNVRMPRQAALAAIAECASLLSGTSASVVGTVGTAFGCPYEGAVPEDNLHAVIDALLEAGASLVYLADTTGMATPVSIERTAGALMQRYPSARFGLHLHNTRGLGLANAYAGLRLGIADFEGSVGGLGGCPFAPRAAGNIATEDLVHMAEEMGISTGVDLDHLIKAARLAEGIVGRTLPGMVMKAGRASERFVVGTAAVKLD